MLAFYSSADLAFFRNFYHAMAVWLVCASVSFSAEPVDFTKQIEPILKARCVQCHGAKSEHESGLKLTDSRSAFLRADSGEFAIVAGKPDESALWHRVTTDDEDERMPPEGESLSHEQLLLIRRWIETGATWPTEDLTDIHWAYQLPQQETPPPDPTGWSRNAIDQFTLAKLHEVSLTPSDEAEPARLLRRVYLDVIGLPPSVDEVNNFLRDPSDAAYALVVDKLLASPRYGEKWARHWLDLARYSDSNGYQADQIREMWAFRDWVIEAMNNDMPYDQFTVEQLAGDLLPNATVSQQIATGFHRATTCNVEAGVDPEGNRTDQVIDRVNTTGTTWLGTTLECAQCHNHKYDPISQQEYYELFAFFNNTPVEVEQEKEGSVQFNFYGPKMPLPTSQEQAWRRDTLEKKRSDLAEQLEKKEDALAKQLPSWIQQQRSTSEQKLPANIKRLLQVGTAELTQVENDQLERHFLDTHPKLNVLRMRKAKLDAEFAALAPPTTLVMKELSDPRETTLFVRGSFLDKGAKVEANVPEVFNSFPVDAPKNRLGFARWLVDPANPLTARVAVNRWWYEFFGRGLVTTIEDFGTQGESPSHPRLLDWLAVQLQRDNWSMKSLHRLIVMSSSYRQSARVSSEQLSIDPNNKWLSRGPRNRLPAELIRDNALSISGQLADEMKGPPVYPPQPDGLWHQTGRNEPVFVPERDSGRHRRGVYVIWRRAAPYPSFTNFDAPDRMTCVARRPTTNTPLQALTLLNDQAYVEIAKAMAARVMQETKGRSFLSQIEYAMRLAVSRGPNQRELELLSRLFEHEHEALSMNKERVKEMIEGVESLGVELPEDKSDWAAWFCVCNAILNLDETISK